MIKRILNKLRCWILHRSASEYKLDYCYSCHVWHHVRRKED